MTRRLLSLLAAIALAIGLARPAHAAAPVVVVLHDWAADQPSVYTRAADGFAQAHAVAANLEAGGAESDADVAAKAKAAHPAAIAAFGPRSVALASRELADLPCVFSLASPPASHAAPVFQIDSAVPAAVQLRWISTVLLDVRSVGVLYDPDADQGFVDALNAAVPSGRSKLSIVPIPARSEKEVPPALKAKLGTIDALLLIPDPILTPDTKRFVLDRTTREKVPAIGFLDYDVENGAVMAIEPDYAAVGEQAARTVDKLVTEKSSGSAPATRVRVVVNATMTRKLGLRADYSRNDVEEYQRR